MIFRFFVLAIFVKFSFAIHPKIIRILNENLNDGSLKFSQYQSIIENLQQQISCEEKKKILSLILEDSYHFECLPKGTFFKTLSYQNQFFPEINKREHNISLNFKNKNIRIKQKLNSNSINDFSQIEIKLNQNHILQIGHLSIPFSPLIGRNYWAYQKPIEQNIFSLASSKKYFHGFYWKLNTRHLKYDFWYSFNPNQSSSTSDNSEIKSHLSGLKMTKKWKKIEAQSHTILQYFHQNKPDLYTILQGFHIKESWLNQSLFFSFSPSSSFHSKVLPWFVSWKLKNSKKKFFLHYSKSSSQYWNPLHPYSSRSDSAFSSVITAYGANENHLHWKQSFLLFSLRQNESIKILPLQLNTKVQWIQKENLKLYYVSYSKIGLKIKDFKTDIKMKYQYTSINPFFSIQLKENLRYNQQELKLTSELKSLSYQGSYPFPSSIEWIYKSKLFSLSIELLTRNIKKPSKQWYFELSYSWRLNSFLSLKSETSLPFKKEKIQNNLYYQIKIKGTW